MENKEEKIFWINKNLSSLLSFPVPPDLIDYICSIENERDFNEYFSSLLDFSNPEHAKFVSDLRSVLGVGEKKKAIPHTAFTPVPSAPEKAKVANENYKDDTDQSKKKQKHFKGSQVAVEKNEKEIGKFFGTQRSMVTSVPTGSTTQQENKTKKKTKYVNLYSQEGQAKDIVLLKGRHKCTCEASRHALINNCLKCGRIVCEQEGPGPCLFCGNLVCSPEQQKQLETGSKNSEKLRDYLMKQAPAKDTQLAIQKRDRLLEFDKTSERLTKVIDDESDYYTVSSVWLSAEEQARLRQREAELYEQLHASRKNRKITLDFSGRCVIEEEPELPIDPLNDPVLKEINESVASRYSNIGVKDSDVNPAFSNIQSSLQYTEKVGTGHSRKREQESLLESRIQDRELQEMSDVGMCLSLHQPWASLLISGLKRHEGRSWYTAHRGTLWIAAAAKVPTEAEIQSEETNIREYLGNPRELHFPTEYPVGCLLGCVNVVDCLSQEEYRIQFPNGPSLEPYVFICEHPRRLPIFFPMKGKHKIFKLDSKLHQAAQKSLRRVNKLQAEKATEAT